MSTVASMAPIHPGEILAEDYLAPLGITQHALAVALHVPPRRGSTACVAPRVGCAGRADVSVRVARLVRCPCRRKNAARASITRCVITTPRYGRDRTSPWCISTCSSRCSGATNSHSSPDSRNRTDRAWATMSSVTDGTAPIQPG